jgi:class 3 adenylate cyclase
MKVALAFAQVEDRPCDVLLLDRFEDAETLTRLASSKARMHSGKCSILSGEGTRARYAIVFDRSAPGRLDGRLMREFVLDSLAAASMLDKIHTICVPARSGDDAAELFESALEAVERALKGDAPPLLKLLEFVSGEETVIHRLAPVLAASPLRASPARVPAGAGEIRIGNDNSVQRELRAAILATELALSSGDLIGAYSSTRAAHALGVVDERLNYLEVLSLARIGDTKQALHLYTQNRLDRSATADTLSLRARLLKDQGISAPGSDQKDLLRRAAEAYSQAYAASKSYFPLINAATLMAAIGEHEKSLSLAASVLEHVEIRLGEGYWPQITRAEALLLCGKFGEAEKAALAAMAQPDADKGSRSSTIKQFERLFPLTGIGPEPVERLLRVIRPAPVLHYCGHIFAEGIAAEQVVADGVEDTLEQESIDVAYGALAAGSDILIAERLLERGGELHVVLPFPVEEFARVSVAPAGPGWLKRFETCLSQAATVTVASQMPYVCDPLQFAHGTKVAMGMAALRASHLGTSPLQLAVWDGTKGANLAGTAVDVQTWERSGRITKVIKFPGERTPIRDGIYCPDQPSEVTRGTNAVLFADFSGFSSISEAYLPLFWKEVMGRAAQVIERHASTVICKNTWGDALYIVLTNTQDAALLAIDLQEELSSVDTTKFGAQDAGMRVALHYGTMYMALDPVTKATNFFGTEVSRTARLEPVTPKHSVYVTETFAAVLALENLGTFQLHFIGSIPLAKNYGAQPVYRLSPS